MLREFLRSTLKIDGINTERKNEIILIQKFESMAELKFDPGFRVIEEYLSQIDSILRDNFTQIF